MPEDIIHPIVYGIKRLLPEPKSFGPKKEGATDLLSAAPLLFTMTVYTQNRILSRGFFEFVE